MRPQSPLKRWLTSSGRVSVLVVRWEVYERVKLHAQALTYDTLLALVPLLAVTMAVVNGFGGMGQLPTQLQELVLSNISGAPEVRRAMAGPVHEFVENIAAGHMGVVSVLLLVFSVLSLLGHIESAFNVIFGSKTQRPFLVRLITYWAVLTLGPMLLGASFAMTATLTAVGPLQGLEETGFWRQVAPLGTTWVAFCALYMLVPLAPVRLRAALPAAIAAGSCWHVAKSLYAIYARHNLTVHNIYGSLATIPLFILWLYLSWLLVLFGAQLAFALQHARFYHPDQEHRAPHQAARELAVCRIFLAVACDFFSKHPPTHRELLAHRLGLPMRMVEDLTAHLVKKGFVRETGPQRLLIPGRDLEQVTVAQLLDSLRLEGSSPHISNDAASEYLISLLSEIEALQHQHASGVHFRELAGRFGAPSKPSA